jgi:hypothetical protein
MTVLLKSLEKTVGKKARFGCFTNGKMIRRNVMTPRNTTVCLMYNEKVTQQKQNNKWLDTNGHHSAEWKTASTSTKIGETPSLTREFKLWPTLLEKELLAATTLAER